MEGSLRWQIMDRGSDWRIKALGERDPDLYQRRIQLDFEVFIHNPEVGR